MSAHDIVVIGGGIHGCAVARELALRGREVVVLERSVPGAEASSVAGGILGPHLEADGGPLLDIGAWSLALYPEWVRGIEAVGADVQLDPCGGALVAFDDAELDRLRARSSGRLVVDGLDALIPGVSPRAVGALLCDDEAQVDPPAVMEALPRAAEAAGVTFVQDTVQRIDGRSVVATSTTYRARDVIVAAGAWATRIPGVDLPDDTVRPARGQIVELKAAARPFGPVLFSERGYVLSRRDGRVLAGSTLEFVGFHKGVTVKGLRAILDIATELVPSLADAEVVATRSGFRPYTDDHLPLIGALRDGLWMAGGHYRNGILLAPATASMLADLVCGDAPGIDPRPFDPRRFLRS